MPAVATATSIVVTASVPPQLQFANILTEWKVTLQRPGSAKTFQTTPFTLPSAQLMVTNLLPVTEYSVWVSVRAGSAEGPLSDQLNVTTQEAGEIWQLLEKDFAHKTQTLRFFPQFQDQWLSLGHLLW